MSPVGEHWIGKYEKSKKRGAKKRRYNYRHVGCVPGGLNWLLGDETEVIGDD
jgi:hypothetical protein